jgi:hypothetical protein
MTEVDELDGLLPLETINPSDMTEEELVELGTTLNRDRDGGTCIYTCD